MGQSGFLQVWNLKRGKLITCQAMRCNSLFDKVFGLLRRSNPRCLIFQTRFGIHTFFLKYSIDVLILGRDYQVVKMMINLKPNRLLFWNPAYNLILELPAGTIFKSKTQVGDRLKVDFGSNFANISR